MARASSSSPTFPRELTSSSSAGMGFEGLDLLMPTAKKRKLNLADWDQAMDSEVWSSLPDDAIERILSWLPIRNLFGLRRVCKKWKNIVSNPSFLRLCAQAPSQGPWFVFFQGDDYELGSVFDPACNQWHALTFPTLPGKSQGPVASQGGLVCFLLEVSEERGLFFVCNPLTKEWIELPRILTDFDKILIELPCMLTDFDTVVTGMVVNNTTKAYTVVVAGSNPVPAGNGDPESIIEDTDGCKVKVFLYSSCIPWGWKISATLTIEGQLTARSVVCNGLLYCVTCRPFGLIAFDVEKECWIELEVSMPRLLTCCFLVENGGRLMMVGGLGKFGVTTSIHIWQLDGSSSPLSLSQWIKVEKMPRKLCKEFFKSSPSKSFTCIGSGDLLYFTCHKESHALLYDCGRQSWHSVPPCPLTATYPLRIARGFCFNPCLNGSVDGRCLPPEEGVREDDVNDFTIDEIDFTNDDSETISEICG